MERYPVCTRLYAHPLSRGYWREASAMMNSLFALVFSALCAALSVLLNFLQIPVSDNLYIFFTYLVNGVFALVCGPVWAIPYGVATDLIGYLMYPNGGFFPGYTLNSVLGALLFALFFFRARITVLRIALCKLTINVVVNLALGCLWSSILFGKGYYYYFAKSLVKNLILLPLEVVLLTLLLGMLLPVLTRLRLTPPQPTDRIPLI